MPKMPIDLKYRLYEESVQCFENDLHFINGEFQKLRKRAPLSLREDFGGTGILACNWVKQGEKHTAYTIDIDPTPMEYGIKKHYSKLNKAQKSRMNYIEANVLDKHKFKSDVVVAFNFSYFVFKKRQQLLKYFKQTHKSLKKDGIFFIDIFGGSEARKELVEETEYPEHSYFWDCDYYNPLKNETRYYIHFQTHSDGKKYSQAFGYDWRMWSPMEIRELMEEAGFSKVLTYWEGEGEEGDGDGNFTPSDEEDQCESWVAYILALH